MTQSIEKPLAVYTLAYSGARTAMGGVAIGTSACTALDPTGMIKAVLVGDTIRYADGTQAVVVSGTGISSREQGRSFAIVGSHVSGGDHIVSTPAPGVEFHIDEDNRPLGFLVPGFADDHS